MAVRLSKVAREFNVGLSTIVEFLHNKGSKISSDPNAKLTDEEYDMLAKAFSTDSKVKKESSSINLKDSRKKKEAVVIDDSGKISTGAEEAAPKDDFISVKDEVKLANHIKIVDRIDLNPERKQPEPEKQEEVAKVPVARKEHKPEKKVKTPAKQQAKVELAEERKPEEEVPQPEKVEAPQPVAEEKPVSSAFSVIPPNPDCRRPYCRRTHSHTGGPSRNTSVRAGSHSAAGSWRSHHCSAFPGSGCGQPGRRLSAPLPAG